MLCIIGKHSNGLTDLVGIIILYKEIIDGVKRHSTDNFIRVLDEKVPKIYDRFFRDYISMIDDGLKWVSPVVLPRFIDLSFNDIKSYKLDTKLHLANTNQAILDRETVEQLCTKIETLNHIVYLLETNESLLNMISNETRISLINSTKDISEHHTEKVSLFIYHKFISQIILRNIFVDAQMTQTQSDDGRLNNCISDYIHEMDTIHTMISYMLLPATMKTVWYSIINHTLNGILYIMCRISIQGLIMLDQV